MSQLPWKTISVVGLAALAIGWFWFARSGREAFAADFRKTVPGVLREAVVEKYYGRLGPTAMLTALDEEFPFCHGEAHELGKVVLRHSPDVAEAFETCGTGCSNGCFHGAMMEAFNTLPRADGRLDGHVAVEDIRANIEKICSADGLGGKYRVGNCAHAVGHALMDLAAYDIRTALDTCKLFVSKPLQFYCSGGAFMQHDMTRTAEDHAAKALHYPCDTFKDFPAACYSYQVRNMALRLGTFLALRNECLALNGFDRLGCIRGYGFLFRERIAKQPDGLKVICDFDALNENRACMEGALEKLTDFGAETPLRACDSLSGATAEACRTIVADGHYSVTKSFDIYFAEEEQ